MACCLARKLVMRQNLVVFSFNQVLIFLGVEKWLSVFSRLLSLDLSSDLRVRIRVHQQASNSE